ICYGVESITISIKYLGEKVVDYFKDGSEKGIWIDYVTENEPLGTIGAVGLLSDFKQDHILVMNSDLLTNIDYEDFFKFYQESDADMAIATIPYKVNVPYAVLEVDHSRITSFREKPVYTYYSNAGIYLI